MKNMIFVLFSILVLSACQNNSSGTSATSGVFETIAKDDFENKMKEKTDYLLILL